ncbi:hypothetical protein D3C86_1444620 [compost metagenome]
MAHQTMVMATATNCVQTCEAMEKSALPVPPSSGDVKMPVPRAPMMPPMPWTPKTSAVSS